MTEADGTCWLWWVVLWDGRARAFEDRPAFWPGAVEDEGPIPLCHDGVD